MSAVVRDEEDDRYDLHACSFGNLALAAFWEIERHGFWDRGKGHLRTRSLDLLENLEMFLVFVVGL